MVGMLVHSCYAMGFWGDQVIHWVREGSDTMHFQSATWKEESNWVWKRYNDVKQPVWW